MLVFLPLILVGGLAGDPAPAPLTLKDLKMPASPAFVLLGVNPSAVERPTTPKAFAVSLISAAQQSDNLIPSAYAAEVAPFWLKARPSLTFDSYFSPSVKQSVLQTLSFSLVTSKPGPQSSGGSSGDDTDLGIGVRTSLLAGHGSRRVRQLRRELIKTQLTYLILGHVRDKIAAARTTDPKLLEPFDEAAKVVHTKQLEKDELSAFVASLRARLEEALKPTLPELEVLARLQEEAERAMKARALELIGEDQNRRGWLLDVCGAVAYRVPAGAISDADIIRSGAWVTGGYRPDGGSIDFLVVARALRRHDLDKTLLDLGTRVILQEGDLGVSGEYLVRLGEEARPNEDRTYRLAVNLDYKLAEGLFLTAAFGRDFANTRPAQSGGRLVAILGLNLGLGTQPTVSVK